MGFSYKGTCVVTSNAALLPSTQSNFTVRVSALNNALKLVANGGAVTDTQGDDINFFSDAGLTSLLSWEIDTWNGTTGGLDAWVLIPSMALGTTIYIGVGNAAISTFQGGATGAAWPTVYKGVYHFPNGTTLAALDSSGNTNSGTITAATATPTSPIINSAVFNGTSAFVRTANNVAFDDLTISFWALINGTGNSGRIFGKTDNGSNGIITMGANQDNTQTPTANSTMLQIRNDGGATQDLGAYSSSVPYDNNFHHHVLTRTGGTTAIYLDGVAQTISYLVNLLAAGSISSTQPIDIGCNNSRGTDDNFCAITIDEFRMVAGAARSADWITAMYNSDQTPATFLPVTFASLASGGASNKATRGINWGIKRGMNF